jgi:hypothetical protein
MNFRVVLFRPPHPLLCSLCTGKIARVQSPLRWLFSRAPRPPAEYRVDFIRNPSLHIVLSFGAISAQTGALPRVAGPGEKSQAR